MSETSESAYLITRQGRPAERRRRPRVEIHCPVHLSDSRDHVENTSTVNISCEGFYCVCKETFPVGEQVTSVIEILAPSGQQELEYLSLQCNTIVVRVERAFDGERYGVAFKILSYSVVRP